MTQKQFYDWQTMGGSRDVSTLIQLLEERDISWCMIGGLAVNHWAAEPMATADVDIVIVTDALDSAIAACEEMGFTRQKFEHSVNLKGQSKVSIQITTAPFYQQFPLRSVPADVHGILMRVASLEDTLAGKIAAYQDADRRPTQKLKDILDIARLVDAHPQLAATLPLEIRNKLNP